MGNSGSSGSRGHDGGKKGSLGFHPLTPQRRPGSVSVEVSTHKEVGGRGLGQGVGAAVGEVVGHHGQQRGEEHAEAAAAAAAAGGTGGGGVGVGGESSPVAAQDGGGVTRAAAGGSRVYGAAYPPEMVHEMMQKANGGRGAEGLQIPPPTQQQGHALLPQGGGGGGGRGGGGEANQHQPQPGAQRPSGEGEKEAVQMQSPAPAGGLPPPASPGTPTNPNDTSYASQTGGARYPGGALGIAVSPSHRGDEEEDVQAMLARSASFKIDRDMARFDSILKQQIVSLSDLRLLCWQGCPEAHRANTWRLLLRYMPANVDRREAMMVRLRGEYADAVAKYFECYDEASASAYDRTMYNQIAVDLPRTNPSMHLFQLERFQIALHRILYVWGIRHPGTGYVQGINDLVTPFLYVFLLDATGASPDDVASGRVIGGVSEQVLAQVEADSYHCLTNMLDSAQDNYVMDSKGIQEKVFVLKRIIERLDRSLYNHLDAMEVDFLQFSFRWFNCLLMREFSLQCTLRLWDTYVSEKTFASFHIYVCAAVLLNFTKELHTMDFPEIIVFLQNLPTEPWDSAKINMIVAQAYSWNQQWSTGHI